MYLGLPKGQKNVIFLAAAAAFLITITFSDMYIKYICAGACILHLQSSAHMLHTYLGGTFFANYDTFHLQKQVKGHIFLTSHLPKDRLDLNEERKKESAKKQFDLSPFSSTLSLSKCVCLYTNEDESVKIIPLAAVSASLPPTCTQYSSIHPSV